MGNVPEGSTVTRPGGLALIYVARGRFFDSQSTAGFSNTENFDKCAKPHEAIKLQFLTLMETQDSPVTYVIYK